MRKNIFFYLIIGIVLVSACESNKEKNLAFRKNRYKTLSLEEQREPENAILALETHPDLEVGLFAWEPMVQNPTNIDIDHRGRVWVCESYNYGLPEDQQQEPGGKISILEDTNGDGKADKKTIFYQGEDVFLALGVTVLGNKVFVTQSPHMMVFTDENGDDKPDKKEILFTGMGNPGDHSAHSAIFGPDGRLYFTYGNAGNKVLDADKNQVTDIFGNEVISDGQPYHGGMIFRCYPDGSEFEVLAHNFRNNYEATVDSYGNIWQSDNDDDGNRSCRINFILEYGNYGYLDEKTGHHWSVPRTGQHDSIPQRHWHQNDPGSVPNLLITGAGSPAGICFYEGKLLPEIFHNQMIHTDAGPNVVRSYPVSKSGAGFTASTVDILWSDLDKWFRPVDVAVAPDGSIMVADWYDPIVGGADVGDTVGMARIYRVSPDMSRYKIPGTRITDIKTAITALKNPNLSTRYSGFEFLKNEGANAEESLRDMWEDNDPVFRARAFWLLAQLPEGGEQYITKALADPDENIRITAIRAAVQNNNDLLQPEKLAQDPSPQVRRTLALYLKHADPELKTAAWPHLANSYDGEDRWYLEALNIGAHDTWEECFTAWQEVRNPEVTNKQDRDIIWISRASSSIPYKIDVIGADNSDSSEIERQFRSFDFIDNKNKSNELLKLLDIDHQRNDLITSLVIQHIDPSEVQMTNSLMSAIQKTLNRVAGKQDYINIIDRYDLSEYRDDLLQLSLEKGTTELGINAMKVLIGNENINGFSLVKNKINEGSEQSEILLSVLAPISTSNSINLIRQTITNPDLPPRIKRMAIIALGKTWWGEDVLLELVKKGQIDESAKPAAASVLFSVYRASISEEAEKYLERPGTMSGTDIPPVRDLLSFDGNAAQGKMVFNTLCSTCHQVGETGTPFGPDLSRIADKLSKEGLYQSIIYPNQGINNGYEGYIIHLNDGGVMSGIIVSDNEEEILLRQIGGVDNRIRRSEIDKIEMMERSLMTELAGSMKQEELVDLVEYLSTLN